MSKMFECVKRMEIPCKKSTMPLFNHRGHPSHYFHILAPDKQYFLDPYHISPLEDRSDPQGCWSSKLRGKRGNKDN